ncbi:lysine--tRNA ligase [Bacillus thuringiensis]|uniref:lysine--tRNA ligase n=1 Tax=Bacillus cereus group TaxID=86661 RepID=UPI000BF95CC7|nr:lysine--tRNA ligase [Bacillus thuringiensis]PFJ10029.1 lysine--tRNA ligase [Bacillus thuringiensis]PGX85647.1 lysine--tRNA ligase [Bacillus thuringiensis]HDR8064186.1 lysine--tRNA ligase [Bacillus cereus]
MHWAYRIATELIEKYPDKDTYVCASGISPSGSVHIGNFREVVTTYLVAKALNNLGKKTKFIFSWDDYDRFRKVPKNVNESFEQYIGMPYSDIPDPTGCHASYAEHFEKEFEKSLGKFGIDVEFIYQNKEYRTGRYNKHILHALKHRKKIYDILMKFKTHEPSEDERNNFYPIALYCENCEKDTTKISKFDEVNETIEYICKCGNQNVLPVMEARNIKLNWKIDWPMRWMVEDVVFEPGGRDHSSETGSYNVSKEIAREIFDYEAPHYAAYDFIGIKGDNKKMSSSSGNIITPSELLKIYLPEIILFMFAKYKPNAAFNIGLDEDVIRNYSEYERFQASYLNHSLKDEDICRSIELSGIQSNSNSIPKFNQVAGILPLLNFNIESLQDVLCKNGEEYSLENISIIGNRVEYWIKNWYPQKAISVNNNKDMEYYNSLNETQKNWLEQLCSIIRTNSNLSDDQMMENLYAICHNEDKKIMRANQKLLFSMVYKLVLNSTNGPRLPILIKTIGSNKLLSLLDFNK